MTDMSKYYEWAKDCVFDIIAELDPASEWQDLHSWTQDYMTRNDLTAEEFLERAGIPNLAVNRLYLAPTGAMRVPSSDPASQGAELKKYLEKARKVLPVDAKRTSTRSAIEELRHRYTKHREDLRNIGVPECFFVEDGEQIKIMVVVMDDLSNQRQIEEYLHDIFPADIHILLEFQVHVYPLL